ncbi:MAG: 50S ribosomal protein L25, partial [Armatimonadetes bacterium]|nr:50S ribosomal protein L25 [Armatimonadota bacterium]
EVQREPVSKRVIHIDFQAVAAGETVEVAVPLTFLGEPQGVIEGGAPQMHRHELLVSCLPANLPSGIEVDISGLGLHAHLTAAGIALPQGVSLAGDPEELIVAVTSPSGAAQEAAEDVAEEAAANDADA